MVDYASKKRASNSIESTALEAQLLEKELSSILTEQKHLSPEKHLGQRGQHNSILIVEDETEFRELMRDYLIDEGYTVLEASNPNEAFIKYKENMEHIDTLITDLRMPEGSGSDLILKINESHLRKNWLSVICLTAFNDLPLKKAYRLGMDAILQKPIKWEDLRAAIEHFSGKHRSNYTNLTSPLSEPAADLSLEVVAHIRNIEERAIFRTACSELKLPFASPHNNEESLSEVSSDPTKKLLLIDERDPSYSQLLRSLKSMSYVDSLPIALVLEAREHTFQEYFNHMRSGVDFFIPRPFGPAILKKLFAKIQSQCEVFRDTLQQQRRAIRYWDQEDYQAFIEELEIVGSRAPNFSVLKYYKAEAIRLLSGGSEDKLLESYEIIRSLLEERPKDQDLLREFIDTSIQLGRAREGLEKAMLLLGQNRFEDSFASIHACLGSCLTQDGDSSPLFSCAEAFFAINPKPTENQLRLLSRLFNEHYKKFDQSIMAAGYLQMLKTCPQLFRYLSPSVLDILLQSKDQDNFGLDSKIYRELLAIVFDIDPQNELVVERYMHLLIREKDFQGLNTEIGKLKHRSSVHFFYYYGKAMIAAHNRDFESFQRWISICREKSKTQTHRKLMTDLLKSTLQTIKTASK